MTKTVWLFCYYDASYKRHIIMIKRKEIIDDYIKNWKDSNMFYSVTEVEVEVCEDLEVYNTKSK